MQVRIAAARRTKIYYPMTSAHTTKDEPPQHRWFGVLDEWWSANLDAPSGAPWGVSSLTWLRGMFAPPFSWFWWVWTQECASNAQTHVWACLAWKWSGARPAKRFLQASEHAVSVCARQFLQAGPVVDYK